MSFGGTPISTPTSRPIRLVVYALTSMAIGAGMIACSQRHALPRAPESVAPPAFDPATAFTPIKIPIATWNLFDLGVVDVNDDGLLDIFTSNHNARQSLLINGGGLRFTDKLSELGLDQDATFPGLEDSDAAPQMDRPGLYVFFRKGNLVLQAVGLDEATGIRGEVKVLWALDVVEQSGFTSRKGPLFSTTGVLGTRLRFGAAIDGVLELFMPRLGAPIKIDFDTGSNLQQIYVGQHQVVPPSRSITLNLRDRHGMAWADVNGDGRIDVLMIRGGLKGYSGDLKTELFDELFVQQESGFVDQRVTFGLKKQGRRSRGVAWVDVYGNDRLDAFVQSHSTEDQLFSRDTDGLFSDVATELALNGKEAGPFVWLDVDRDHDMDLLFHEDKWLVLRENGDGAFASGKVATRGLHVGGQVFPIVRPTAGDIANFAVADFDRDGDMDVFAASRRGSRLLLNTKGRLFSESPESFGLPKFVAAASWVDFDNDGLEDLFAVPDGLYRQIKPGRFEATGLLVVDRAAFEARCTWVDLDNDGLRDVIFATKPNHKTHEWHIQAYRNVSSRNNWLQVKLIGSRGNRQAIGAFVSVSCGAQETIQMVGHAEGSHYSQGHYRLYFGLGGYRTVDRVRVTWPDGATQELHDVDANALLTIKQE